MSPAERMRKEKSLDFPFALSGAHCLLSVALFAALRTFHCHLSIFVRSECFSWGFVLLFAFTHHLHSFGCSSWFPSEHNYFSFSSPLNSVAFLINLMNKPKLGAGRSPFQNTGSVTSSPTTEKAEQSFYHKSQLSLHVWYVGKTHQNPINSFLILLWNSTGWEGVSHCCEISCAWRVSLGQGMQGLFEALCSGMFLPLNSAQIPEHECVLHSGLLK